MKYMKLPMSISSTKKHWFIIRRASANAAIEWTQNCKNALRVTVDKYNQVIS